MKNLVFTLVFILVGKIVVAQTYPIAPEIWSEPKLIKEIADFVGPYGNVEHVSVTADGMKLFISGIAYLEKTDSGWTKPKYLNKQINNHLAERPCISPNGKRLFIDRFINGWYLYYSDWDSVANDWGFPINCGSGVNTIQVGLCAAPDNTTIIYDREGQTFLSVWDSTNNTYSQGRGFPYDDNPYSTEHGFYITRDYKKLYNDMILRWDTLSGGKRFLHHDIGVSYRSNLNHIAFLPLKPLNFCVTIADSLFEIGVYKRKMEGSPSLTADGKTMYFMANYTGRALIYETHMLIDENGDTVTTIKNSNKDDFSFSLNQNYPNPFNPTTAISYTLNKQGFVKLIIYDSLGRKIAEPISEWKTKGMHYFVFNSKKYGLSSGVYYYQFFFGGSYKVKKMILAK